MGNSNSIEVYADYIYYVPVGDKDIIEHVKDTLMNASIEKSIEYLSIKTIVPIAIYKESMETKRNIIIKLDPIVEEVQAYVYAAHESPSSHMLICLKYIDGVYILTQPRYIMVDGNDPEKGIYKEFSRLSNKKLDNLLLNKIKPIAIINKSKDTILYISKLVNNKHIDNDNLDNMLKLLEEKHKKNN